MRIWRYELDQEAKDLHPLKTLKVDAHLFYTLEKSKTNQHYFMESFIRQSFHLFASKNIYLYNQSARLN